MILFQNGLITLNYDPATDLMHVEWPQFHQYALSETKHSLQVMVETIRNYDIKKLFLDTTNAEIEVSDEEYIAVLKEFGADLSTTRLQKASRIIGPNYIREQNVQRVKEEAQLPFPLRDFTDKESALLWLLEQ